MKHCMYFQQRLWLGYVACTNGPIMCRVGR